MTSGSLRLRLAAGGAMAIAVALVIAGFGLTYLFERHTLRTLADDLEFDLRQILAALEVDGQGRPSLTRAPTDPRFAEPLSGLYWQIAVSGGTSAHSRSLWDATLSLPSDVLQTGDVHRHRIVGPKSSELLAVERTVTLKAGDSTVAVRCVVAADLARLSAARQAFTRDLIPSLVLLGSILAAATWLQVGLGLRPLDRIRDAVATVRRGTARRLEFPAPTEVAPLVEEINALLTAQSMEIERSRSRAADMAHGLKTPLAALAADVQTLEEKGELEIASQIAEIGNTMRRHVDREIARARIRGSGPYGAVTSTGLRPLIDTLVTIQRRTSRGSQLKFEVDCPVDKTVAMDKADLAEALGNLIENATSHAASTVRISVSSDGCLAIDDDGPGIPESQRQVVLQRGTRLDSRGTGAGLGLAIVSEVLDAHGRTLELTTSPLGGLRAAFAID